MLGVVKKMNGVSGQKARTPKGIRAQLPAGLLVVFLLTASVGPAAIMASDLSPVLPGNGDVITTDTVGQPDSSPAVDEAGQPADTGAGLSEVTNQNPAQDGTKEIRFIVDGVEVLLTHPIVNQKGRTYYPLRACLEALGAQVQWDGANQTATATLGRTVVVFSAESSIYAVNGYAYTMADAKAYLDPALGRVYIPIRYAAEAFGYQVRWESGSVSDAIHIVATDALAGVSNNHEVMIAGKRVWLGQTYDELVSSMGYPSRIDESAYDLQWYIYNRDYEEFIMVGVKELRVTGFFTNCLKFEVRQGLGFGSAKAEVSRVYQGVNNMEFWFDPFDGEKLYALWCMENIPSKADQQLLFNLNQNGLLRAYEQECLDITNAFRLAHGKPEVYYNNYAARIARQHAQDMAERNFFSHINPDNLDPMDRMEAGGLNVYKVTENLGAGFSDPIQILKGWVESESHRGGMLENNEYLGVGAYYKKASKYSYYIVQEFITF